MVLAQSVSCLLLLSNHQTGGLPVLAPVSGYQREKPMPLQDTFAEHWVSHPIVQCSEFKIISQCIVMIDLDKQTCLAG